LVEVTDNLQVKDSWEGGQLVEAAAAAAADAAVAVAVVLVRLRKLD
jgi:hypothetical protein